ncbi:hypothetical protein WICPIJ_007109 [Wickerhamomyces pijperi]|uniref:tRNA (guanine(37)-N1)-methyltransferase n=1 Tax=Wickerhamomyces pijperi TaxID=599730 RepID=A0A9P8Q0H0_WICPI|nr:hypothetical protein WICPIJ_007109 [Wickerhamomyces pijperi]
MGSNTIVDLSPPVNRSMTQLDRDFFQRSLSVVIAFFPDPKKIGEFTKKFNKDTLGIKKVKNIVKIPEQNKIGVLLTENLQDINQVSEILTSEAQQFIQAENITLQPYQLTIPYSHWKSEEILGAILPESLLDEIPSGFTITGHIAHLNLRSEFKPYGELIGQVLLDKNPNIKTVVNKLDSIDTVYRTFAMEVLAGEDNLIVEQRESNCLFKFDFSKVYWNSRLHTEHERLVKSFNEGDFVIDVMAGVGPFAVPAGKKRVIVLANDLNPESYKYMSENIAKNKVGDFVKGINEDGRVVIRESYQRLLDYIEEKNGSIKYQTRKRRSKEEDQISEHEIVIPKQISHFVMNLPDSALEFLNEYDGIFRNHKQQIQQIQDFKFPMVHVYCFEKFSSEESPEPTDKMLHRRVFEKMKKIMNYDQLQFDTLSFHTVRKVSPTKPMFCVSFPLPEEFLFREPVV